MSNRFSDHTLGGSSIAAVLLGADKLEIIESNTTMKKNL